jgi:YD repeat-containing protein
MRQRGLVSHCSITATYTYDACPFSIGRLCTRVDASGSYAFTHDVYGNPIRQDYITGASPAPPAMATMPSR